MDKIIVFGLGHDFKEFREMIEKEYNVIGYSDNNSDIVMDLFVAPNKLKDIIYDKILICSRKYFYSIKIQLIEKYKINIEQIIGLDSIIQQKYTNSNRFKKVMNDIKVYREKNHSGMFEIEQDRLWLIDSDAEENAGQPCVHYFAQDIWGAQKIFHNNPKEHYDIGSRLDGFISHLLVFRKVNYIDIRPLPYNIPNLIFVQGDATHLSNIPDNSIESLSSFHAIEHFGLGRYGDPINPEACFQAMKSMVRVTKAGGHIYLGVPIGPEDKLIFNAHRIFCINTILDNFKGTQLVDARVIEEKSTYDEDLLKKDWKCIKDFSCGLFEFVKN